MKMLKKITLNMLLLLSHFSHVRLCATPQTAAHQAPPSLGFSRQEHQIYTLTKNLQCDNVRCWASQVAQWYRICLQCRRPRFDPWVWKMPWRRQWQPTPVFLPGEFHGERSLVGYSSWGCKESDTTEQLTLSVFLVMFL